MLVSSMKKLLFFLLINTLVFTVKAQQVHFVYLQTDNGQPFYVKLDNKIISSSSEGYIILPEITDGDYKLIIGFPKNKFPEENFAITVDKKNEGFLLKNFDEKGWQLFNLQTLALIPGTEKQIIAVAGTEKKEADSFSQMLAGVVKDSSILQNHQPVVPVTGSSAKKTDTTTTAAVPSSPKDTTSIVSNAASVPVENPKVTKILSAQDKNGLQMIYQDKNNSSTDTVSIFFPEGKSPEKADTGRSVIAQNVNANISPVVDSSRFSNTSTVIQNTTDTATNYSGAKPAAILNTDSAIRSAQPAKEKMLIESPKESVLKEVDTSMVKKEEQKQTGIAVQRNASAAVPNDSVFLYTRSKVTDASSAKEESDQQLIQSGNQIMKLPASVTSSRNSDCKNFATDNDFLKLRKKMAEESGYDKMIQIAKKYFKSKCYSTDQVKNLSYIFLTNDAKYQFFEAAYPFISDSDQFSALESQFNDTYNLNRFRAMVNK